MITGFPEDLRPFRLALIKALTFKGLDIEASLVNSGALTATLYEHGNWDGGIDSWGIKIEISLETFIEHESKVDVYEGKIRDAANLLFRGDDHNNISGVSLVPVDATFTTSNALVPEAYPALDLWRKEHFRLFISHCSSFKREAKELRDALATYGVSAFVAHEDIKPTKIWLTEIEKALDSMDALTALLTSDFPASEWCDQEVGIAIGKNKLVIPIRLGIDPYGFMGKYQGLAGHGMNAEDLAKEIVIILLNNPATKSNISAIIISKFVNSGSFLDTRSNMVLIENLEKITEHQAKAIVEGLKSNDQIYKAYGIKYRVNELLKKHGYGKLIADEKAEDEIPF